MAFEPVNGWNPQVLIASESSFGTSLDPAASQAIEVVDLDMGPPELGQTRDRQDRAPGRGMRQEFVEGRVEPIGFTLKSTLKSRAAAATASPFLPIFKAAGLTQTLSGSAAYTLSGTPVESNFAGLCITRILGSGVARYAGERGRGGVVKKISLVGGDQEVLLTAEGAFIGKYHQGYSSSITLASDIGTSLVFADAEEGYRFAEGFYICESEIIEITAMNYSTFTATIQRAQLSSSGAAHSAQPLYPYFPTPTYTGSPIPETTCTVTFNSQALRCVGWTFDFQTGMDHLPGETGSKYRQQVKGSRYDASAKLRLVCHREDLALLGKMTQRKSAALAIVQGTGTGSICTINLPQAEIEVGPMPANPTGDTIIDVTVKGKDSTTGNDMMNITLT